MDLKESKTDDEVNESKKALAGYAKYTGMAFQMLAIIGISAFIGFKTDEYYKHSVQWVTALTSVLGVCLSIYQIMRQLKP
ncbi:MAG: AtpZ/AtpI family protein [Daejeonella sp.]